METLARINGQPTLERAGRPVKYLASAEKLGLGVADIKKIDLRVIIIDKNGRESAGELVLMKRRTFMRCLGCGAAATVATQTGFFPPVVNTLQNAFAFGEPASCRRWRRGIIRNSPAAVSNAASARVIVR